MNCYRCGSRLTEQSFCTNCGADVGLYKKIVSLSHYFYNEGLEKANVRDLSGAVSSLQESLKLYKNNIEARNLLGLIFFEMGETVAALSEWVISKNLQAEKNIADDYIDMIQNNPGRLETINQTIKKYNQALVYCYQGSIDLAIIQLKKVLSMNSKFVQAHQLLALCYIQTQEWEKAYRELKKCERIDVNHTLTRRYLKEVEPVLYKDEQGKPKGRPGAPDSQESREVVKYQSGNETIIQPVNVKEPRSSSAILNIVIGLVIGVAISCFLILPGRVQAARSELNRQLQEISNQADAKTSTITELEAKAESLTKTNEQLQGQLDAYVGTDGTLKAVDSLMRAVRIYLDTPKETAKVAEALEEIDPSSITENTSKSFTDLYRQLLEAAGPAISQECYREGNNAYKAGDYDTAVDQLTRAFTYDNANGEALFTLGNAYRKQDDTEHAVNVYKQVIELFPNTEKARRAQDYLKELQPAQ